MLNSRRVKNKGRVKLESWLRLFSRYFPFFDKYNNKRARNMKFTSIFFTASADYIRAKRKSATSEQKKRSLLRFFYGERRLYSRGAQINNKRARNIKLAWIFFKASADYIRAKRKSATSERKIWSLLEYISKRAQFIFARSTNQPQASEKNEVYFVFFYGERRLCSRGAQISHKRARNMKFTSFFLRRAQAMFARSANQPQASEKNEACLWFISNLQQLA